MTITASEASPATCSSTPRGRCGSAGDELFQWSTFSGPVGYYGPWSDAYGPQGPLTLLVRAGSSVTPEEALAALDAETARSLEDRVTALEAEVAGLSQPEPDAEFIKRLEQVLPRTVPAADEARRHEHARPRARPAYP